MALPHDMRVIAKHRFNAIMAVWAFGLFAPIYLPIIGFLSAPLVVVATLVLMWSTFRTSLSWGTTMMDADGHLRANELDQAEALYADAPRRSWWPVYRVISIHFRAVIHRMRGNLPLAATALDELIASGWLRARAGTLAFLAPDTYGESALIAALLGDVARAESLLAEARSRLSPIRRALVALPEAVLRARRAEWDACIEHIDAERERARGLLRPHDMRALAIIEAYALTRASTLGYRDASRTRQPEHALADARPTKPGEYAYLGQAWPELQAFVSASLP